MTPQAIYPGTFDPVTYGHIDLMKRATQIFGTIIVAVARSVPKGPLFTLDERLAMLTETAAGIKGIRIEAFDGLVIDYARKNNIRVIVRGLRMISDFEYEFQLELTNRRFAEDIETVFLMPSEGYSYLSSTLLKEAAALGADVSVFIPDSVARRLRERLKK